MRGSARILCAVLLAGCGTDAAAPIAWTHLAVRHGWGPCEPGTVCVSTWTVTRGTDGRPEATVAALVQGIAKARTLDEADRNTIAKLLDDAAFRDGMGAGFGCGQVLDYSVRFTLELEDGASLEQDVSGCVVEQLEGAGALPRQIDRIIAAD
jgi:hypothetical protein